jgi:hypothetical protein
MMVERDFSAEEEDILEFRPKNVTAMPREAFNFTLFKIDYLSTIS